MTSVFADSGHWIALLCPWDQLHQRAKVLARTHESDRKVTTEMVLVEVLNHLSGEGDWFRSLAVQFIRDMEDNADIEVIPQTASQFKFALERYANRPDQSWGLTDCASFLVMEELGITEALAYDHHFEQAGFVALLRGEVG